MKVLFNTYPSAFQSIGGGEIQLLKTKEYLEKLGIEVKLFDQWKDKITDYDIFHSFSTHSETAKLLEFVKSKGVPIVISTIFWTIGEFAIKDKNIKNSDKMKIFAKSMIDKYFTKLSPTKSILEIANILLPNGIAERDKIIDVFKIDKKKFKIIPNGVDKKYANTSPEMFNEKYGLEDFVLSVGAIGPRKNQFNLIRALKGEDIPIVLIGSTNDKNYLDLCKREGGKNVHILGFVDEKMLMSAYAACKTFALLGWYETPGLTALEAGLAGVNVVITNVGTTKEYFKNYVQYVNFDDIEDVKEKVVASFNSPKNDKLKKHILKNFTWEKTAEKTLEAYERVL